MNRSPSLWAFTVADRGFENAVVDKYSDLFDADPVLHKAWADYWDAKRRIERRMSDLAAQQGKGE